MRWYLNEQSLQGQFQSIEDFEALIGQLMEARARNAGLMDSLRIGRLLGERPAVRELAFRQSAVSVGRRLRPLLLNWIDRAGPFVDDDRLFEAEDYFECMGFDVTNGGLGEAARRLKFAESAGAFSFEGGAIDFAVNPLIVVHGLDEDPIASYSVVNIWRIDELSRRTDVRIPPAQSWEELIEQARRRYPRIFIPDSVFLDKRLSREPFDAVIRDRAFVLLGHLNAYVDSRAPDGSETALSRSIVETFFVGGRALFTAESTSNQNEFRKELTFKHPLNADSEIFAHWHGKISHRHFRMHFEWPVPEGEDVKILYLGPKLTKD